MPILLVRKPGRDFHEFPFYRALASRSCPPHRGSLARAREILPVQSRPVRNFSISAICLIPRYFRPSAFPLPAVSAALAGYHKPRRDCHCMATEKQIAANRLNAQKSTGPRTPEGKSAVSQNALKHGLRARYFLSGDEKEKKQYYPLFAALTEEWQPATPDEELLVERMALAHWKLAHLEHVESIKLLVLEDFKALGHIWPHQARLERCYDKARAQLRALQAERAANPQPQRPPAVVPEPPAAPAPGIEPEPAPAPAIIEFPAPEPAPPADAPAAATNPLPEPAPDAPARGRRLLATSRPAAIPHHAPPAAESPAPRHELGLFVQKNPCAGSVPEPSSLSSPACPGAVPHHTPPFTIHPVFSSVLL